MEEVLEPIRIVGGERMRRKVCNHALDRFTVALDRRRFTNTVTFLRDDTDDRGTRDGFFTTSDLEGMDEGQIERRHRDGEHRRRFQPCMEPSSARRFTA